MAKLTLSVDSGVVARTKRYAARRGTSISQLVERFLSLLSGTTGLEEEELPPILARLRADLEGTSGDRTKYHKYLERKYR